MDTPGKTNSAPRKDRDNSLSAPHVLFAMFCLLLVFAVVTYVVTDSFTTTLFRTALSSMCLQIGYFAVVIYLVLQRAKERKAQRTQNGAAADNVHAPVSSRKNADV